MSTTFPFARPADDAAASTAERTQRFGLLLAALLLTILVQGASPPGDPQRVAVSVLVGATLVLSLRVGEARARIVRAAAVLAVALAAATLIQAITGHVSLLAAAISNGLLVL